MRTMLGMALGVLAVVQAITGMSCAQSFTTRGSRGEIVREIDDPNTGERWLLIRDERLPGGPGHLVPVAVQQRAESELGQPAKQSRDTKKDPAARPVPVIRSGDLLIVEEHTAVMDTRLEARALNSAALGSALRVRLTIGAKELNAVALGPGRAILRPMEEVRP